MSDCSPDQNSNSAIPELNEAQQRYLKKQRQKKFEEDKVRKRKDACSPWPAEAWRAAHARVRAGVKQPEPRFPIIITDFMTPQKLQELDGLPSPPEMGWTTTTVFGQEELDHPKKLQYCVVTGHGCILHLQETTTGEDFCVWFEGEKRYAWSAHAYRSDEERRRMIEWRGGRMD
ncbi:hypothetical protein BDV30DRAFT_205507 [Aspergillus minisclerotigenes]|uniref:Uncharacterized protein n=1 Tax=Aspergillus minisclerotigenes TaxID=656917 RepID=A0A5N6JEY7_9EURO|nr:hypothetical protein BDV30DRAFT_205507 [Aspergillus minisclerotigenes]